MQTLLWLDDVRDPLKDDWHIFSPIPHPFKMVWVVNYEEFVDWITKNGLPDGICFDHDLSDLQAFKSSYPEMVEDIECNEKTGYDCAKWLVDYCMDNKLPLPKFNSQSANPSGRENILKLLENYKKYESSLS